MDSVAAIPPSSWRAVPNSDGLPPAIRADASLWAERFFTPEANPHARPADVQWSYAIAGPATPDAIRYIYRVDPYDLDTIETRAFTVVRLKLRSPSATVIEDAANRLLLGPGHGQRWRFQFPEALTEGSRFSSDPSVTPIDIATWEDLVEGGIRSGAAYLVRFKKLLQRQGYEHLPTWFDPEFRARG
ncbi:MAG: hypothetical protein U0R19_17060 [Bryobacteraceae bacterium]